MFIICVCAYAYVSIAKEPQKVQNGSWDFFAYTIFMFIQANQEMIWHSETLELVIELICLILDG